MSPQSISSPKGNKSILLLQLIATASAILATADRGSAVLIPLGRVATARWAIEHGGLLLGEGRLPGTVLARFPGEGVKGSALRAGILMLPAFAAGCNNPDTKEG